jgi:hypothetical protein
MDVIKKNTNHLILVGTIYIAYYHTKIFINLVSAILFTILTFAVVCGVRFMKTNDANRQLIFTNLYNFFEQFIKFRQLNVNNLTTILSILFPYNI